MGWCSFYSFDFYILMSSILGMDRLIDNLLTIANQLPGTSGDILYNRAKPMMDMAQGRCPVSEKGSNGLPPGSLRDSGRVENPRVDGREVSVVLSFGAGLPDNRAIYAHENLEARHRVGQAKYLESVLLEKENNLGEGIASDLILNWERFSV